MPIRPLIFIVLATSLSGCGMVRGLFTTGGEGLDVEATSISDIPTKNLVKGLPDDLRGDKENARHTNDTLQPDDSGR